MAGVTKSRKQSTAAFIVRAILIAFLVLLAVALVGVAYATLSWLCGPFEIPPASPLPRRGRFG